MDNPYLHRIPFFANDIQRLQAHIAGNSNTLLIASIPDIEQRIWIDGALAWELAERQTILPRQLSLDGRLTQLLDISTESYAPATSHLLSIALDIPTPPQGRGTDNSQWRDNVCRWFGLLNQEREALTLYPLPILLWVPSAMLQDFIQSANDLWAWRSDHIDMDFPSASTVELPCNTDVVRLRTLMGAVQETVQMRSFQNVGQVRASIAHQLEMMEQFEIEFPELSALSQLLAFDEPDLGWAAVERQLYLNWLIERNEYLDTRGTFQTQRQVQLKLDEIYIGLQMQADAWTNESDRKLLESELAELEERLAASGLSAEEQEDQRDDLYMRSKHQRETKLPSLQAPISLEEAADQHEHLAILGDPGSGKTTLLRYLALQYAQANRASHPAGDSQPPLFPILVRIADYADDGVWNALPFIDFLPQYFKRNGCKAQEMTTLLTTELEQGGCLVLLDGLDEIVDADDRRGIVQRIQDFVSEHEQGGTRGTNRFVITSRIAGYRSAPLGLPFAHYVVEEMDDTQMERFLERWCRAVEDVQTPDLSIDSRQITTQEEVDGIMDAIRASDGVRRLASNPLMLRTLALIHRTGARLPQMRIELYKLAADTLARTWRPAQGVRPSVLIANHLLTPLLGLLAYWMHEHKPTGVVTEREVYEQLGTALAKRQRLPPWDSANPDPTVVAEIDKFLLAVREHTGLFVERAPQRYGFMHLTFEEYYAARHLVARSRTRAQLIRKHLHDPRWEEPILLALGFVSLDYPDEAGELLETAILAQGEEAEELNFMPSKYEYLLGRDYLFALRCLGDQIPAPPGVINELATRFSGELLHQSGLGRFAIYCNILREQIDGLSTNSAIAERLIPEFLAALRNKNPFLRCRAATNLGKWKLSDPDIANALIKSLNDSDRNVRSAGAISLVNLGLFDIEIINIFIADIKGRNQNLCHQAEESLIYLGKSHIEVIDALIVILRDSDHYVRARAAALLGTLAQAYPKVTTALITALKDDSRNVRFRAAESLGKLGSASPKVINSLISTITNRDENVSAQATAALVQLGQHNSLDVTGLIALLRHNDCKVRIQAAESLIQLDETKPEVISTLLKDIKNDDEKIRYRSAENLLKVGHINFEIVDALLLGLNHSDDYVRLRAAKSLGELGKVRSEVIAALIYAFTDDDWNVRVQAAESLAKLGDSNAKIVNALIDSLQDDYIDVRYGAIVGLGKLRPTDERVINALTAALKDSDCDVSYEAAVSLISLDNINTQVFRALTAALHQSITPQNRSRAAQLIGELSAIEEEILNVLFDGLLDEHDTVRAACATALAQLGKRFPIEKSTVEEILVQAISDPAFKKEDYYKKRTAQDYAYDGLWQLVVG